MVCPNGHEVTNTSIHNFTHGHGCIECSENVPWSKRMQEFIDVHCTPRNYELLSTEEEWIEGTKKYGNNFKPRMLCPNGHVVTNTSINSLTNGHGCIKCSDSKSEKMVGVILAEQFDDNIQFDHNIRPDFLKYKSGKNLELDYYCESLKLAVEYNGKQHYQYCPDYFHREGRHVFLEQLERDAFKKKMCETLGIHLIIVPYQYTHLNKAEMTKYIVNEIEQWKKKTTQPFVIKTTDVYNKVVFEGMTCLQDENGTIYPNLEKRNWHLLHKVPIK